MLFQESFSTGVSIAQGGSETYLLREEILHPRLSQYLRKLTGVTERIWQPCLFTVLAEPRLEVSLAIQVLPDQTLPARHVRVVLEPSASNGVESVVLDVLFDPVKSVRVEFFEP